jgi:hypothetical protein|tara:strand:- start:1293 stop:1784 length:492 start_codon:yes stop_codon:yes gene_type:complete
MAFGIFKARYKLRYNEGFESGETMAEVIGEEYDNTIKIGFTKANTVGAPPLPPVPMKSLFPTGLTNMMKVCFKSNGRFPLSRAVDLGLTSYWAGAVAASGAPPIVTTPGFSGVYIDTPASIAPQSVDEFLDKLTTAFETYHSQLVFISTPPIPPLVGMGFQVF